MPTQELFDAVLDRDGAAALEFLNETEKPLQRGASAHSRKARHALMTDRADAHLFIATHADDAEGGREPPRQIEFSFELHRIGNIDKERRVHFLLLMKLFEIRAFGARENIPIDKAHVVAGGIVAVIAELGAGAAFRREMFAPAAIGESAGRVEPDPMQTIEVAIAQKRRELGGDGRHGRHAAMT
jgi:hypothetical protein